MGQILDKLLNMGTQSIKFNIRKPRILVDDIKQDLFTLYTVKPDIRKVRLSKLVESAVLDGYPQFKLSDVFYFFQDYRYRPNYGSFFKLKAWGEKTQIEFLACIAELDNVAVQVQTKCLAENMTRNIPSSSSKLWV